jgi:hypothetical protein
MGIDVIPSRTREQLTILEQTCEKLTRDGIVMRGVKGDGNGDGDGAPERVVYFESAEWWS